MTDFGKEALMYSYTWIVTEAESKRIIGFPDNVLLRKYEGNEILYFINRYMATRGMFTVKALQKGVVILS